MLAHLIKSLPRALPPPRLPGSLPVSILTDCTDADGCNALLRAMPAAERALLEFLVRLILEVNEKRKDSKMGTKNLTVIFAPNLWLVAPGAAGGVFDPTEELRNVQRVETALQTLCTQAQVAAKTAEAVPVSVEL